MIDNDWWNMPLRGFLRLLQVLLYPFLKTPWVKRPRCREALPQDILPCPDVVHIYQLDLRARHMLSLMCHQLIAHRLFP